MKVGDRVLLEIPSATRLSAFSGMTARIVEGSPYQFGDEVSVELDAVPGSSLYVEKEHLRPFLPESPDLSDTYEAVERYASEHYGDSLKATNPKDAIASGKLPLHLWPKTASIGGALALLDGMLKYGRTNWRVAGVKASVYVDALERHVTRWFEGEETDPESGLSHLWHALACLAILVDAQAAEKLVDDRQYPGGFERMLEESTPHVVRLKELRADKNPKHYTRADV